MSRCSKLTKKQFKIDYFTARATLCYGKFLHVTFTPKGNNVKCPDFLQRLESTLQTTKGIDYGLFSLEKSKQGVYHVHGFIHLINANNKLSKIKKSDLVQLLIAKSGNPEGWIDYLWKDSPNSYLVYSKTKLKKKTIDKVEILDYYIV